MPDPAWPGTMEFVGELPRAVVAGYARRMKKLVIKLPLYAAVALLLLNLLTLAAGITTYHRLSDEALIAQLSFEQLGPQHYRAHLVSLEVPGVGNTYDIAGDQWQIDAQFLKVKPWANVLGVDALFRLDRLSGRYRELAQQTARPPTAYDLSPHRGNWLARFMQSWDWLVLVADAEYGSSTYANIDTDTLYTVYRTQTGLITRRSPRL